MGCVRWKNSSSCWSDKLRLLFRSACEFTRYRTRSCARSQTYSALLFQTPLLFLIFFCSIFLRREKKDRSRRVRRCLKNFTRRRYFHTRPRQTHLGQTKGGTLVFYDSTLFHEELRGGANFGGNSAGRENSRARRSKEKSTVTEFRVISPP